MQLRIDRLRKVYHPDVIAIDDLSMTINNGLFGLLGPNGAGKSTLIRMIATLQEPDAGEMFLGDIDIRKQPLELKKRLGYLPQEFGFYPKDTASDLLDHFARLKGIALRSERKRVIEELLKRVNLWDCRKRKLGSFSGGMKQRFGIAQALLGNPQLIIVDEPTAGLDPEERNRFHNLLSDIGEQIIVILSTHIVDDVSDLCTEMAIIDQGRLILKGKPFEEVQKLNARIWKKETTKAELADIESRYRVLSTRLHSGRINVHVYHEGAPENGFVPAEPTLEDAYFCHLGMSRAEEQRSMDCRGVHV